MEKVSGFILPIAVALVVLMYTSLAVLTFSTARADQRFAERNISYNEKYYLVEGEFERTISELNAIAKNTTDFAKEKEIKNYLTGSSKVQIISSDERGMELLYSDLVSPHVLFKGQFRISGNNIDLVEKGLTNIAEWEEQTIEVWKGSEDGD